MLQSRMEKNYKKEGEAVYPSYWDACLPNVSPTLLSLLNVKTKRPLLPKELYGNVSKGAEKVVLFLIDGFGYSQWEKYHKGYGFFKDFTSRGLVSPITTIFPSTTSAALTSLNTSLTPQEHGLPEWNVYMKELGMVIQTLPFTPMGERGIDRLLEMGADPRLLFEGRTVHQSLRSEGVRSFTFISGEICGSAYSKLAYKGSEVVPYVNVADMAVRLRKALEKEKTGYFYVYVSDVDSMEHEYGPHTEEYHAQLSLLSHVLKKEFVEKASREATRDAIVALTADHGQLNVDPEQTIYLDRFRKVNESLRKDGKETIIPTGGPRDVFIHVKPGRADGMLDFLSTKLKGKATVMLSEEAVKKGLFGINRPAKRFLERVGDILVLPHGNGTVWYRHPKRRKFDMLGHHGGLSRDEMLIPFASADLQELR